jgi:hypothetical protein
MNMIRHEQNGEPARERRSQDQMSQETEATGGAAEVVFRVTINGGDFYVKNDGIGHAYFILYDGLGYI